MHIPIPLCNSSANSTRLPTPRNKRTGPKQRFAKIWKTSVLITACQFCRMSYGVCHWNSTLKLRYVSQNCGRTLMPRKSRWISLRTHGFFRLLTSNIRWLNIQTTSRKSKDRAFEQFELNCLKDADVHFATIIEREMFKLLPTDVASKELEQIMIEMAKMKAKKNVRMVDNIMKRIFGTRI